MNTLIVLCHPEQASFNAGMKNVAFETMVGKGHSVEVSDLYHEGFDPVEKADHYLSRKDTTHFSPLSEQRHAGEENNLPSEIEREIERLERADLVIFQFPLWWHDVPAILKGWFDRVFVNGKLYTSTMRYDRGYFAGKRAICSVTTGAPAAAFGPMARGGDIDKMLWSIHYSLNYMGFAVLPQFVASGIQGNGYSYLDEDTFKNELESHKTNWVSRLMNLDSETPLQFPTWQDWDDAGRYKSR